MHNDVDAQFETLICTCSADVDTHVLHAVYTVGHMTGTRMLRGCLVPKIFQDSPSHRMFRHIHRTLNVDEERTNYTV
jgi:hypothetical protein